MRALVPIWMLLCIFVSSASATEEFAELTEKGCTYCHIDPSGGAELTSAGKDYFAKLTLSDEGRTGTETRIRARGMFHYLRLMAGYLHVLMGIFWFGTILYVHLILKPAYAAHGLPRGEVRLGLASIGAMAVTGTILTFARVPSLSFFVETRFGILLMIKIGLFLIMAGTAVYVVTFLGPRLKARHAQPEEDPATEMTKERLLSYDGTEGRPAYFAFAGKVYDVSRSEHWTGGKHFGRHSAGEDLTEAIKQAPHGEDKVLAMTQVGEFRETNEEMVTPKHTGVFFFLAYLNLAFVLSIILILALWRWW